MKALLAHDHEELDRILRSLYAALDADDVEEGFKQLDLFRARLGVHIRAENLRLFPAILDALTADKQPQNENPLTLHEAVKCRRVRTTAKTNFSRECARCPESSSLTEGVQSYQKEARRTGQCADRSTSPPL